MIGGPWGDWRRPNDTIFLPTPRPQTMAFSVSILALNDKMELTATDSAHHQRRLHEIKACLRRLNSPAGPTRALCGRRLCGSDARPKQGKLDNAVWLRTAGGPFPLLSLCYVIAMKDRRAHIVQTLQTDLGLSIQIIDPVMNDTLNLEELVAGGLVTRDCPLNTGEIACHLSHLRALATFLDETAHPTCTIFEDDLVSPYTRLEIAGIHANVVRDLSKWDMVFWGRCWDDCTPAKKVGRFLYEAVAPKCLQAYTVTRAAARLLLQQTVPLGTAPGDNLYRDLIRDKKLKAVAVVPQVFAQARTAFRTTLNNGSDTHCPCLTMGRGEATDSHFNIANWRSAVTALITVPHGSQVPVAALQQQIGAYLTSYLVKAVVVLNGNPDFKFRYEHPRVQVLTAWAYPPDALWFAVVQDLTSDLLLTTESLADPQALQEGHLADLLISAREDPLNVFGYHSPTRDAAAVVTHKQLVGIAHDYYNVAEPGHPLPAALSRWQPFHSAHVKRVRDDDPFVDGVRRAAHLWAEDRRLPWLSAVLCAVAAAVFKGNPQVTLNEEAWLHIRPEDG